MKNLIVCSLIFWILLAGCINRNRSTIIPEKVEQKKSKSIELINSFPKFDKTTNSNEIRQTCDSIMTIIDRALPELKKVEKKITIFDMPNTPVTIWYSDSNLPVKMEHAVADESREFTGKFQYYFIAGHFWYSYQIFARYIFDNNKLIYWLDEHWRINEIPAVNFQDREMTLKTDIEKLLNDTK